MKEYLNTKRKKFFAAILSIFVVSFIVVLIGQQTDLLRGTISTQEQVDDRGEPVDLKLKFLDLSEDAEFNDVRGVLLADSKIKVDLSADNLLFKIQAVADVPDSDEIITPEYITFNDIKIVDKTDQELTTKDNFELVKLEEDDRIEIHKFSITNQDNGRFGIQWDLECGEDECPNVGEYYLNLDVRLFYDQENFVDLKYHIPLEELLRLISPADKATNVATWLPLTWQPDTENRESYLILLTSNEDQLQSLITAFEDLDIENESTVVEFFTAFTLLARTGEIRAVVEPRATVVNLSTNQKYYWTVVSSRSEDFLNKIYSILFPSSFEDDEEELLNLNNEDYYIYSPFEFETASTATPVPELTIELSTTPVVFDNSIPSDVKSITVTAKTNREAICFSDLSTIEVDAEFETTDNKTHTFRVEDVNLYKNFAGNFYFAVSCEDVDSSTLYTRSFIEYSFGAVRLFDLNLPSTGFTNSSVPVRVSLKDFVFPYMKVELSANNFENSSTTRLLGAFCNPSSNLAVVRQSCNDLGLSTPSVVGPRDLTLNWNTTGLAPGSYEVRVTGTADNGKSYNVSSLIRLDLGHGSSTGSGVDCRNFRDVPPNHPQYLQVVTVCEAGFFTGQDTPSGRLADLQSSLIRAESFALACRMRGGNCRTINQNFILGFRDLTQNDLNDARRSWMWGPLSGLQGIVRGYGDGTVRVEGFVSQVEFGKLAMESLTNIRVDDRKNPWFTDVVNYYNDCARLNLSDRAATRGEVVNIMYQTITQCSR